MKEMSERRAHLLMQRGSETLRRSTGSLFACIVTHPMRSARSCAAVMAILQSRSVTSRGRWRSGAYRRPVPRRKLKISRRMCGSRPTLQCKHNDMDIAMPMEEIGRWSRREAGLLSSQKQEIQVCERTRPNKKYPGLGPCSESRASSNDSPRYFLFALVLPHRTAAHQRRPSRLQTPV